MGNIALEFAHGQNALCHFPLLWSTRERDVVSKTVRQQFAKVGLATGCSYPARERGVSTLSFVGASSEYQIYLFLPLPMLELPHLPGGPQRTY